MAWLHIVVLVGLVSIIVPLMFCLLICLKLSNFTRGLIVAGSSVIFTGIVTFYIYTNFQLYIMIGAITVLSIIAGLVTYYLFEKNLSSKKVRFDEVKAG